MKKCFLIKDNIYNTFVAYDTNHLTSDCWSVLEKHANKYFTLKEAKKVKRYMAKICNIKLKDLSIIKSEY